jgi:hypothetical protein
MTPTGKGQPPKEDWGESIMPGERSGEGSAELFRHIQKDERRKAGVTPKPVDPDPPPPGQDPDKR